jgi:hypothetical protein
MTPQLVQNVLTQHLWQWNLGRRIKLGLVPEPDITDLSLIIELNEEAQQLKFAPKELPYPGFERPNPPPSGELFGFDWKQYAVGLGKISMHVPWVSAI